MESQKTRIYALAIILNPTLKFDWIDQHCAEDDEMVAQTWICTSMLEYQMLQ
ncbi:hypothetical protein PAXRUDRAFT_21685 [Paxillus rubicundulus Ve08.2h10]|uniref:Uncharacterized protein n=1 Tax=Paxillus rubicundulus Ve08.2h10 TaxID=930991 RepID=A0A0D0D6Y1_9AGAM|nr:hypothetical protein PAXRUDRAFT_21685 [Paxillus rubicundulus Ve08.2h10]